LVNGYQVHANFQPADCSESQKQDSSIGIIDFNFPTIVTETAAMQL